MSFEKSGKNTGTRRKARECALQMLFAADVVDAKEFSVVRYWGELGFDELQRGSATIALEFRDEIGKFTAIADGIKSWLKKTDPLEKTNRRNDWVRGITVSIEAYRRAFTEYTTNLVHDRTALPERMVEQTQRLRSEFDELITQLDAKIVKGSLPITSDDRSQFTEYRIQGSQIVNRLQEELVPSLTKLTTAVAAARPFANRLVNGTVENLSTIDDRIRTRAEHWRIERMAIVDRNVLRLAVYEFLYEDTPHTVVINEALEIARRFSTFEATQFINGILDAIKLDLEKEAGGERSKKKSQSSST